MAYGTKSVFGCKAVFLLWICQSKSSDVNTIFDLRTRDKAQVDGNVKMFSTAPADGIPDEMFSMILRNKLVNAPSMSLSATIMCNDANMCKDARSKLHCLAAHALELSEKCMRALENDLPRLCALELDAYRCNRVDTSVIDCLVEHRDNLSDNCGNAHLIVHQLILKQMVTKLGKNYPADEAAVFKGCPVESIEFADSNSCCTYDTAFLSNCSLGDLRACATSTCERPGNSTTGAGRLIVSQKENKKDWLYHCCPRGTSEDTILRLVWNQAWHASLHFLLVLFSIACIFVMVLYVGPEMNLAFVNHIPWHLNDGTLSYGAVPVAKSDVLWPKNDYANLPC